MRKISIAFIFALIALSSIGQSNSYLAEIEQWHNTRIAALKTPSGWLNLEGLFWLKAGVNRFGSAKKNDIVFANPAFPAYLGDFVFEAGKVHWKDAAGEKITVKNSAGEMIQDISSINLLSEREGEYMSQWKDFVWVVIQREDKVGVRFRNLKAKTLLEFKGIERFPVNAKWRIKAKVIPQDQNPLMIMNVLGQNTAQKHGGQLVFEMEGKTYRLDAIDEGGIRLFVTFADATSGKTTYGSGRFIELEKPDANGETYIDFNKAYNPPCAFTEFATCPLPPPQNRLTIAIPAGEKKYGHH
ncbi:MAG: DUF1684 domain-containing protein [Sediminibacterium sp.]|nr:DUF1684 domain-containing protein [Sediminibacterium sp.]MBP6145016.1 DUF1684 domain-containing protein [Sediminibacterium sp.]